MLRVFGVKIDKDTGEILKEKTLIFRCISEADYEKRGKKNAESRKRGGDHEPVVFPVEMPEAVKNALYQRYGI